MGSTLALHASTVAFLLLGGTGLVILVFLVIAPWRTVRDEPPISEEAETRLLLGEDFEEVEQEVEAEHGDAGGSRVDGPEQHQ